jgi:hypothetical protein
MGDFFVAQMGDVYLGTLCFDASAEGKWGIVGVAIPHSAKVSVG